jgi:hypothetical protein
MARSVAAYVRAQTGNILQPSAPSKGLKSHLTAVQRYLTHKRPAGHLCRSFSSS